MQRLKIFPIDPVNSLITCASGVGWMCIIKNKKDFSQVVWFHGGGLKAGKRSVPKALQGKGIAVVAVNYRLHPK